MEIILHFYFPFKVFPENERMRVTERARAIAIAPDLVTGSRSRLHRIEIAVDAISRRSRSRVHEIAIDGAVWVVACVFLNLCFPSSFPNTRKYFPEIFLKCNQTPWKHFPFPKIIISGKYVFSGKRFTATKHNLNSKNKNQNINLF